MSGGSEMKRILNSAMLLAAVVSTATAQKLAGAKASLDKLK
jgi:hypothetical protein